MPLGSGFFGRIAKPFFKALKNVGYNRYVSYEICSPRYVKHKIVSFEDVDNEVRDEIKGRGNLTYKAFIY